MAKRELYRVPILGWTLRLNNYIKLNRTDRKSIVQMMRDCQKELQKGCSLMIFPEGTRSKNGELKAFKDGAFKLAIDNKVDIIPIVINGPSRAFPGKGKPFYWPNKMHVNVLPEIRYESFKTKTAKELSDECQKLMKETLEAMRKVEG